MPDSVKETEEFVSDIEEGFSELVEAFWRGCRFCPKENQARLFPNELVARVTDFTANDGGMNGPDGDTPDRTGKQLKSIEWYEVWIDTSIPIPYILLVRSRRGQPDIEVIDPRDENKVVFQNPDYDAVRFWLLEDEYSLVEGRVVVN